MDDNDWIVLDDIKSMECPPSGRYLKVEFENGDLVEIEFSEIKDEKTFEKLYKREPKRINFPITAIELKFTQ